MALTDFSPSGNIVHVNGREITGWGESDPPYTDAPIDPKNAMKRGTNKNAIKTKRDNPGRTITINVMPGTSDASFLQGLFNSGATVSLTRVQIGTLEKSIGTEGVITNDGTVGRGGQAPNISDDQFTIEFNLWNATKGGNE
ncbi:hypothetical protein [Sessilibacter corallicola]|uniref:hypothetical protein n=1 Tax=Sessilibacter corallicola TaxID=2904075 RepID=UPI001E423F15|nr:hypothetical protein [Sessilibacter corallicola]MCE2029292.1 hypothetical protein [Sessilibacter corallicola]